MGAEPRPYLENEFLRVEINPETGNIARLYDKTNKREAFHGEGNSLTAWEDTAEQARKTSKEYAGPAWDIGLTGKKWDVDKAARVEITEQGPARATIRVVHRFRDSEFIQDISLMAGVPRVDVAMTLDWYERATFLKADFPVSVEVQQSVGGNPLRRHRARPDRRGSGHGKMGGYFRPRLRRGHHQ